MSVEAVTDIAVHLGAFKTYDMLAQGTYRLKIRGALVENTGQRVPAVPYLILDNRFSKNKLRQHLFEAEIDSKHNAVLSNSFFVRYCDQESLLDHLSLFRISYTGLSVENYEVLFDVELLALDVDGEKQAKGAKQPVQDKDGFVHLTTSTLRLHRVAQGIHEFVPVLFGDYLFSFVECHFHSTMMAVKSVQRILQFINVTQPVPAATLRASHRRSASHLPPTTAPVPIFGPKDVTPAVLEIFEYYQSFLLEQLVGLVLYTDSLVKLFENSKAMTTRLIDEYILIKEQLLAAPAEFPEWLAQIQLGEEVLLSRDIHSTDELRARLTGCRGVPSSLVTGLCKSKKVTIELVSRATPAEEKLADSIEQLASQVSSMIHFYYFKFVDLLFLCHDPLTAKNRAAYRSAMKQHLARTYLNCKHYGTEDLGYSADLSIGAIHEKLAAQHREQIIKRFYTEQRAFLVENLIASGPRHEMPVIFVETYSKIQEKPLAAAPPVDKAGQISPDLFSAKKLSLPNSQRIVSNAGRPSAPPKQRLGLEQTASTPFLNVSAGDLLRRKSVSTMNSQPSDALSRSFDLDKIVRSGVEVGSAAQQPAGGTRTGRASLEPEEDESGSASHLVVLVHGYEGCSFDMKLLKNVFCHLARPHLVFHSAVSNQDDSTCDIDRQGKTLAEEVLQLVQANFPPYALKRLSFIGHSLGGLVVRAALPHLQALQRYMHAYISIATPHLGCSNSASTLVKTGLSVFSKLKGHKSLSQMNLSDAAELKDTFIMRLSRYAGVEWFEHFVVLSSHQDLYVPFESARIEYGFLEAKERKKSLFYRAVVSNILGRLRGERLVRADLNFRQGKGLDGFIGRSAHIRILENLELQLAVAHHFMAFLDEGVN